MLHEAITKMVTAQSNMFLMILLLVIIFLWFSSPVSSHLIARLEVATDEEPQKHYKQLAADANGEMTVLSERDREDKTEEEKEARNGAVL